MRVSLTAANTYEGGGKMFCNFGSGKNATTGDLHITNGNTLNLVPGTYIFYDSQISLQGGTLQCPTCTSANGVTIILTGSKNGLASSNAISLNINGGATVNLHASTVSGFNAAFNGILFYMDKGESNSKGGTRVTINGGATTILSGGMYFPSVDVKYSGNVNAGSACTELVAYALEFTGNSNLDISACNAGGASTSLAQSPRLLL